MADQLSNGQEQNQKLPEEYVAMTDAETMKGEEKITLMEELHRSKSNSSSVSHCITIEYLVEQADLHTSNKVFVTPDN
jgi:hypothetical protein